MKIKKPQIEEYSKELKRCNYSTLNSKNSFNHIEIVVTQGGRLLNDAIFKENFFEIKPLVKKFITHIKEEPKKIEAETMSYIQNYLLYKEIEEKLLTKKPNYPQKTLYHNIESETTRNCYRKAIIIKPIDSDYLSL